MNIDISEADTAAVSSAILKWAEANRLVDIAPQGIASQSSTSRWSQPDDAERATRDTSGNFAFHTDTEDSPWWQLDLKSKKRLSIIVVENRRPPFQSPEGTIVIQTSVDGASWTDLYSGFRSFGSDEYGVPLILFLDTLIYARFFRIRLRGTGALHFKRIRLFTPIKDKDDNESDKTLFLATRTDGLCQRLLGLLNAMVLSEVFDGQIGFLWMDKVYATEDSHVVDDKKLIFNDDFIEDHLVRRMLDHQNAPIYGDRQHSKHELEGLIDRAMNAGVLRVHQATRLERTFPNLADKLPSDVYKDAFERIGFSEQIKCSLRMAQALELPEELTVIHIRGGDIIHGKHSYHSCFAEKALSAFEIQKILSELTPDQPVLLIGQEMDVINHFTSARPNTSALSDLADCSGLSDHQKILFDVAVMARATKIIAADSAVPQLAAAIGDVDLLEIKQTTFDQPDWQNELTKFVDLTANQKAFCLLKTALHFIAQDDWVSSLPVLEKMIKLRLGNVYYHSLCAIAFLALGQNRCAKVQIANALECKLPDPDNTFEFMSKERVYGQFILSEAVLEKLKATASQSELAGQFLAAIEICRQTGLALDPNMRAALLD